MIESVYYEFNKPVIDLNSWILVPLFAHTDTQSMQRVGSIFTIFIDHYILNCFIDYYSILLALVFDGMIISQTIACNCWNMHNYNGGQLIQQSIIKDTHFPQYVFNHEYWAYAAFDHFGFRWWYIVFINFKLSRTYIWRVTRGLHGNIQTT